MERDRTNNHSKESGIALVMALVITLVVLLLIGSLTMLFTGGFRANVINRQFTTVYEAANGGVEYSAGLINTSLAGVSLSDIGSVSVSGGGNFTDITNCTDTTNTATVRANTADGIYRIDTQMRCLGNKPIPGYGGWLKFPPPPAMAGGGIGGSATHYNFYSIISVAQEINNPANIGRTEAIYRVVQ